MATVVTQWNDAILEAIRTTHPGPPIVARSLAIVHTCMYDAWAAYDNVAGGTRLGGLFRRPRMSGAGRVSAKRFRLRPTAQLSTCSPPKSPISTS